MYLDVAPKEESGVKDVADAAGRGFLPDRAPAPPPRESSRSGRIGAKGVGSMRCGGAVFRSG
jgi:hypothetical protein